MQGHTRSLFQGLSWRLAKWVLLFSLSVAALLSGISLWSSRSEFLADKRAELDQIGDVNLQSLANAIWHLDRPSLRVQLEGMLRLPDMEYAEIVAEGGILEAVGRVQSQERMERLYPLRYEFRGVQREMGQLRVVLGLDSGWQRITSETLRAAALESTRTMALAAAMLLLFYSLVARHLRRMAEHTASLTMNGLDKPLVLDRPPPGPQGPDELDQLAGAMESMRAGLHASVSELRRTNEHLSQEVLLRQQADGQLRAARATLRDILDSMPSMVVGFSLEFTVTHCNATASRLAGVDPARALGMSLFALLPSLGGLENDLRLAVDRGESLSRRRLLLEQDATPLFVDLSVFPLLGESGPGAVLRLDDVTELARMEEFLVQSDKMASLGSLAAGMAHEINNPLAGVVQNAQTLERRLSPGLQANVPVARETGLDLEAMHRFLQARSVPQLLEAVRVSGERAARIVRNMLKFARRGQPRQEHQDITQLLDAALELAQNDYNMTKNYDFRRITINRRYEPGLPPVPCAPSEVEQVVLNILQNAAQAMWSPEGFRRPPAIEVAARLENGFAVISISDNGPGMEESVRRRAFEPFFTTKPPGEGTGLGLSVSYFIITQNHGGSLQVDSAPGKGTTFLIRLPLRPDTPPSPAQPAGE